MNVIDDLINATASGGKEGIGPFATTQADYIAIQMARTDRCDMSALLVR